MSKEAKESMIGDFFKDKSILITGATGLVGKTLVFKILNSLENVKKVYILLRDKDKKSFDERFTDLITKSRDLFTYLKSKSLLEKLVPIKGDTSYIGLGLSETDRNNLITDVSIVFHAAADITFEADLKSQTLTNVGGTKEVIELCKSLKHLDAFVHISTAYSNPPQLVTEEKIYESHQNPYELLETARKADSEMIAQHYLGEFPNTYTFTKNLAEHLVKIERQKSHINTAIVRPGIVSPSYREPIQGWVDSLNGISGAILMGGVGLARTGRGDLDARVDPIPVDIVANTCIAVAWTTATKYKSELRVYNCNSSCLGAPTARTSQYIAYDYGIKYPVLKTVRPLAKPTSEFWMLPIVFHFVRFFSETCFAYLCDFVLLCIGEKRFVVKLMKRLHRMHDIMQRLIGRKWYFTNNNFVQLTEDMVGVDKDIYFCDVRKIDWVEFAKSAYFSARKIFLKEKDEDVQRAIVRMKFIRIGYSILNHFLLSLFWYILTEFTPIGFWFNDLNVNYNIDLKLYGYYSIIASATINFFTIILS